MKKIFLSAFLLICSLCSSIAQQCARSADVYYRFLDIMVEEPQDRALQDQYNKLAQLDALILKQLKDNSSFSIIPLSGDFSKQHGYILEGLVFYESDPAQYIIHLLFQPTCANRKLAESKVSFQLYPSWEPGLIVQQAVSKLMNGLNLKEFESNEREIKNYGLGGDLWGGKIDITVVNKILQKGKESEVLMEVLDCDGQSLPNKQISTEGTIGGIFTPSKFTTNGQGVAKVKFKMTSDKEAILKASCQIKNVFGCQDLYSGVELLNSVSNGYKVSVEYIKRGNEELNMSSREDRVAFDGFEQKNWEVVYSFSLFYSPAVIPRDGEQVMIMPQFENYPETQKKGKTLVLHNLAYARLLVTGKELELTESPVGTPPEKPKPTTQVYSSSFSPLPPGVSFIFKNNELVFFSADVPFPEKEEGLNPPSGSF